MKIYLIRHGQTTGDIEDRFGGDYDDHLTELGKEQAKKLAEKLTKLNIEKIFYSPRIRARETADIIIEKTKVPSEVDGNLRERNSYGILTGMVKKIAKEKSPNLVEKLKDPKATIEGAEDYEMFKKRVVNFYDQIVKAPFNTIGTITHGGVISCFLREIIGQERKKLDDCAIIELDYKNGKFNILSSEGLELE
jgi:broad specificity phosphatase PhoE